MAVFIGAKEWLLHLMFVKFQKETKFAIWLLKLLAVKNIN